MTETEWLTAREPKQMLRFLANRLTDRKLRMFQVACCWLAWDLIPNNEWRESVIVAEQYADKAANDKKRIAAVKRLQDLRDPGIVVVNAISAAMAANKKTMDRRYFAFYGVSGVFGHAARQTDPSQDRYRDAFKGEQEAESQLVRDIFGNPFRPVSFNPAWRTTDVTLLTRAIYDEKAFDRMPVLADALQDSGCESEDILNHCRDSSLTHVRGCWVVDLILGKE